MITVKAVLDENGGLGSEIKPNIKYGSHFDGVNYYFFESDEEKDNFFKELENK